MSNNKVLKAGFWYTICNFFVKGLVVITTPIFTRIMSSEDIGLSSNITSSKSLKEKGFESFVLVIKANFSF